MTRDVYFLYAQGHHGRGSVVMRCRQLARLSHRYLSDRYRFMCRALPRKGLHLAAVSGLCDAVIIVHKALVEHLDEDAMARLKTRNIAILADPIDKPVEARHLGQIDMLLAASHAQATHFRAAYPVMPLRYLPHHADPRLAGVPMQAQTGFAALYLGSRANMALPPDVRPHVHVMDIQSSAAFADALPVLPRYGLHYAVRGGRSGGGVFKPFTKGFTAAACGANILIQRGAHDAVVHLGADYPYLIADAAPATIRQGFAFARDSFGGPMWHEGLDRMAQLAARSAPGAVAADFGAILDHVTDTKRPALPGGAKRPSLMPAKTPARVPRLPIRRTG